MAVVMYFHSGGLQNGSKEAIGIKRDVIESLAKEQIAYISGGPAWFRRKRGWCRPFYGPPAGVDEAERVAEQGTIGCDQNLPGLLKDNLGILAREFGCMCLFKKKLFKTNI